MGNNCKFLVFAIDAKRYFKDFYVHRIDWRLVLRTLDIRFKLQSKPNSAWILYTEATLSEQNGQMSTHVQTL